ncbi:uncharacterized protein LOC105640513 [Jatropha curcas]|uniref:uncharacterized protein LOC105640513 n=1 Tax=Jatropha curcas TaxID=180498 RepID=UPI0005FAF8F0|nr:uncharacterized protein LOC105640513 [Jatropha curcas]
MRIDGAKELGSAPSFLWRSLWESRKLLKAGLYWRIGTGDNGLVRSDPWLPSHQSSMVTTARPDNLQLNLVSELIISNGWNEPLLNSLFNAADRAAILALPLSVFPSSDRIAWKFDAKGKYRSRQRRVPVANVCPVCHGCSESVMHVLVTCPVARNCWLASNIGWQTPTVLTFKDWLLAVFLPARAEDASLLALVRWSLWQNRNDVNWNNRWSSPLRILSRAQVMLSDGVRAHLRVNPNVVCLWVLIFGHDQEKGGGS